MIHVIPQIDPIYGATSPVKNLDFKIYHQTKCVGTASALIFNYKALTDEGQTLRTVAKDISVDACLALRALSQHEMFQCAILYNDDLMMYQAPLIVYLSRLYIYPEYRGQGFGKDFVKMLPVIIQNLTFSTPLAMAVYIQPQNKAQHSDTSIVSMTQSEVKQMKQTMLHVFESAGFAHANNNPAYRNCLCWVDRNRKAHGGLND